MSGLIEQARLRVEKSVSGLQQRVVKFLDSPVDDMGQIRRDLPYEHGQILDLFSFGGSRPLIDYPPEVIEAFRQLNRFHEQVFNMQMDGKAETPEYQLALTGEQNAQREIDELKKQGKY